MPRTVAARSLSSLNETADAPPLNPPLQLEGEEPLILYIARVPGSRDVFLTTMKPRDKVVSANDVESSLYYCHLSNDQDAVLLEMEQEPTHSQSRHSTDVPADSLLHESSQSPISPVSKSFTDRLVPGQQMHLIPTASSNQMDSTGIYRIVRKPVKQKSTPITLQRSQELDQRPKILGPRPIPQRYDINNPQDPTARRSEDDKSISFPLQQTDRTDTVSQHSTSSRKIQPVLFPGVANSDKRQMTLIRRDPATGDQWNVGKLSSEETRASLSPSRSPRRRDRDVKIEIFSPGYLRFANQVGQTAAAFTSSLSFSSPTTQSNSVSPTFSPSARSFSFMTPWGTTCKFNTAANGRVLKCYNTLLVALLTPPAQATFAGRSPSMLVSELRFNLPSFREKSTTKKKENRRPLSYSSNSFGRNGFTADLLKTRQDKTIDVVSLKPRLPPRPKSYQGHPLKQLNLGFRPRGDAANRQSTLSTNTLQSDESGDDDEDDDNDGDNDNDNDDDGNADAELDLSLGQERAGGGFSGNKAKLGKLIIYGGQGLAMLDLLVSANMGVWFKDLLEV